MCLFEKNARGGARRQERTGNSAGYLERKRPWYLLKNKKHPTFRLLRRHEALGGLVPDLTALLVGGPTLNKSFLLSGPQCSHLQNKSLGLNIFLGLWQL